MERFCARNINIPVYIIIPINGMDNFGVQAHFTTSIIDRLILFFDIP